jgi:hypothetical protein
MICWDRDSGSLEQHMTASVSLQLFHNKDRNTILICYSVIMWFLVMLQSLKLIS